MGTDWKPTVMIPAGVIAQGGAVVPTAPTSFTATPSTNSVSLSWTAPSFNGGTPITSYTITRGGVFLTNTAGNVTSFNDTGLSFATAYSYTVLATNVVGSSSTASVSTTTLAGVPGTPTIGNPSSSYFIYYQGTSIQDDPNRYATSFSFTITTPASNGSALTGIEIESSSDGTNFNGYVRTPFPPEQPELGYGNVGYVSGAVTIYDSGTLHVRMRAVNAAGVSAPSNTITVSM